MKLLLVFVASILLSACGGGSSTTPPSSSSSVTSVQQSSSSQSSVSTADYSDVSGLYNATNDFTGNEQYYYIGADGLFTAYNYLGDSVDQGDNCYREPIGDEPNAQLTGQTLDSRDDGNFSILAGSTEIVFVIDDGRVSRFSGIGFSAGGIYTTVNGTAIALTKNLAEDITIDEILASLCE